ncbi:SDR family oxidoreductase [Pseudonocardia kongjuensis]|uniref:SDR family oxidoreductase n=1 Tax=Pseudonocardia kongjuensis TaxID=102227 RepID=UPI0031D7617E
MTDVPPAGLFDVTGRTALVTGGTSGIGLMIAEGLLAAGARVLVSSRKPAACAAVADRLGARCTGVPADVGTPDGARALVAAVDGRLGGRLDILVNNAGATWGAPIDDFPDDAWDKLVGVNLTGVFRLTSSLLPALRAAATDDHPARVINIGSLAGLRVTELENYPYSATKAAVHMLTRHLARRLAAEHVTVNAIAPGYFPSRMSAFVADDPDAHDAVRAGIPRGRWGRPDDVVGATVFLSSRAGSYLTGVVLPVDGGVSGCT